MDKDLLTSKIAEARAEISAAEGKLEAAIGAVRSAPRAEKTTIDAVLEEAFTKLRAAHQKLVELEAVVSS